MASPFETFSDSPVAEGKRLRNNNIALNRLFKKMLSKRIGKLWSSQATKEEGLGDVPSILRSYFIIKWKSSVSENG